MNIYLIRLIAAILIPSLLFESGLAKGWEKHSLPPPNVSFSHTLFTQQALKERVISFMREAYERKLFTRWTTLLHKHKADSSDEPSVDPSSAFDYSQFLGDTHPEVFKQSFSGLRTIFGGTSDAPGLNTHALLAVSIYAYLYALERIRHYGNEGSLELPLIEDPRPSGHALRIAIQRGYQLAEEDTRIQIDATNLGIVTTPIAQSAIRTLNAQGGVIVTASHNPLKYNGIKFISAARERLGLSGRGALLSTASMAALVAQFNAVRKSKATMVGIAHRMTELPAIPPSELSPKRDSVIQHYIDELGNLFPKTDLLNLLKGTLVAIDTNGGAGQAPAPDRSEVGLITWVLERFGLEVVSLNKTLGQPQHLIEPTPESDQWVMKQLQNPEVQKELKGRNPAFTMIFDFDADRGNLSGLNSQEHAALNVAMRLAWMDAYHIADDRPVVIIASDFTSLRIESIAALFNRPRRPVTVRRVETGEVNVAQAMQEERHLGKYVPLGIEGANGGMILGEATSRDGIASALLTALALADPRIQTQWASHLRGSLKKQFIEKISMGSLTLEDMRLTLPSRHTELWQKPLGLLDVARFKTRLEMEFRERLQNPNDVLGRTYSEIRVVSYQKVRTYTSSTGDDEGWILLLTRRNSQRQEFICLRPSQTEPLIRFEIDALSQIDNQQLRTVFNTTLQTALRRDALVKRIAPLLQVQLWLQRVQRFLMPARYEIPFRFTQHNDEELYHQLAAHYGLQNSVVFEIGHHQQNAPAAGLIQGGASHVYVMDTWNTSYLSQDQRITPVGYKILPRMGQHVAGAVIFDRSLEEILNSENLISPDEGAEDPTDAFYSVNLLERVLVQSLRLLQPSGRLFIRTSSAFSQGLTHGLMGTQLTTLLSNLGFTEIQESWGENGEIFIAAQAPEKRLHAPSGMVIPHQHPTPSLTNSEAHLFSADQWLKDTPFWEMLVQENGGKSLRQIQAVFPWKEGSQGYTLALNQLLSELERCSPQEIVYLTILGRHAHKDDYIVIVDQAARMLRKWGGPQTLFNMAHGHVGLYDYLLLLHGEMHPKDRYFHLKKIALGGGAHDNIRWRNRGLMHEPMINFGRIIRTHFAGWQGSATIVGKPSLRMLAHLTALPLGTFDPLSNPEAYHQEIDHGIPRFGPGSDEFQRVARFEGYLGDFEDVRVVKIAMLEGTSSALNSILGFALLFLSSYILSRITTDLTGLTPVVMAGLVAHPVRKFAPSTSLPLQLRKTQRDPVRALHLSA